MENLWYSGRSCHLLTFQLRDIYRVAQNKPDYLHFVIYAQIVRFILRHPVYILACHIGNRASFVCCVWCCWLTDMHLWRTKYDAFIHNAQRKFIRRLIIVPLSTFHHLADTIGDPEGELTFVLQVPRAGSTLLIQVYCSLCAWCRGLEHFWWQSFAVYLTVLFATFRTRIKCILWDKYVIYELNLLHLL